MGVTITATPPKVETTPLPIEPTATNIIILVVLVGIALYVVYTYLSPYLRRRKSFK